MKENKRVVLIIEDDKKLRDALTEYITRNNWIVISEQTGGKGLDEFFENKNNIDIILLDVMLPDIDGFKILKVIRQNSDVPIIMLTAREAEEDQLEGLNNGADNYIIKPFLMKVLLAHMEKLIQRKTGKIKKVDTIEKGALRLEREYRRAYIDRKFIVTTPKEFDLLVCFAENENIVLSREKIIENIWGYDYEGDVRTVDTLIKQLRKKLTKNYPYIVSIYGIGYRFEVKGFET